MADITSEMVKDLRDKTGAGMMDCKKALAETGGDIEKAVDYLRKSGAAKAEKKSGRAVKEGKALIHTDGKKAAMAEILCETDFVATNPKFVDFVKSVTARLASGAGNGDITEAAKTSEKDALVSMVATIGENIQLRRAARWETDGAIASYTHLGGKIGVMADIAGETDPALLSELCMHIAAFRPRYIAPEDVPAAELAREKEIAAAQVQGKPANIVDKIVGGKLEKWYSEVCLLRQPWIKDDKTCISKLKPNLKVKRFLRWEVGEEL
jgi:elongation factor Ts